MPVQRLLVQEAERGLQMSNMLVAERNIKVEMAKAAKDATQVAANPFSQLHMHQFAQVSTASDRKLLL